MLFLLHVNAKSYYFDKLYRFVFYFLTLWHLFFYACVFGSISFIFYAENKWNVGGSWK